MLQSSNISEKDLWLTTESQNNFWPSQFMASAETNTTPKVVICQQLAPKPKFTWPSLHL